MREEGNPTGGFGWTPPEQQERLSHKGLIDYPYGNEPLGRFLLYPKGTNYLRGKFGGLPAS